MDAPTTTVIGRRSQLRAKKTDQDPPLHPLVPEERSPDPSESLRAAACYADGKLVCSFTERRKR